MTPRQLLALYTQAIENKADPDLELSLVQNSYGISLTKSDKLFAHISYLSEQTINDGSTTENSDIPKRA